MPRLMPVYGHYPTSIASVNLVMGCSLRFLYHSIWHIRNARVGVRIDQKKTTLDQSYRNCNSITNYH